MHNNTNEVKVNNIKKCYAAWHPIQGFMMGGLPNAEYPVISGSVEEIETVMQCQGRDSNEGWQIREVNVQMRVDLIEASESEAELLDRAYFDEQFNSIQSKLSALRSALISEMGEIA